MKVLKIIPSLESIKNHLIIVSGMIVYLLFMTLSAGIFLLMMAFMFIMDSILDFYDYLFKGKLTSKPPLFLTQSYRLVRIGTKTLKKKLCGLKSTIGW